MRFFSGDDIGIDSTEILDSFETDATDWELEPAGVLAACVTSCVWIC